MALTSLPSEILKAVLAEAVRYRTISRALRLRLVNRQFAEEVLDAICTTKKLDACETKIRDCPMARYYIKRRTLGEKSTCFPEINHLKNITQRLTSCETSNSSIQDTVFRDNLEQLCALVWEDRRLSHIFRVTGTRVKGALHLKSFFNYDVLTAAAAMGKEKLVEELAKYVNKPKGGTLRGSHGFIPPVDAQNLRILDILFEGIESRMLRDSRITDVLTQAAIRGDIETVNHVLASKWVAQSDSGTRPDSRMFEYALATPSVQIFNKILAARGKLEVKAAMSDQELQDLLSISIVRGWADMARHLIHIGASLDDLVHVTGEENMHLTEACESGHADSVQLLLDHGANITDNAIVTAARHGHLRVVRVLYNHGLRAGDAMPAAARGGHLSIVRFLAERGEDVNVRPSPPLVAPIVSAIQREHTAMFRYLIEQGAVLNTPETGGEAVKRAKEAGLESMLQLLHEYGVTVEGPDESGVTSQEEGTELSVA